MDFAHLHVHTHYSLLDGLASPLDLAHRAKELKQPALAITDHGNMFGAIDFYNACKEVGIKPIIGMEAYIAPVSRLDKQSKKGDITRFHLTLLAKNEQGYLNLMQLSTLAYLEGFYYRPRMDYELLDKYKEGIICLTGCIGGLVNKLIVANQYVNASKYAVMLKDIYGEDLYLEIMDSGLPEQETLRQNIPTLSDQLGVPVVATNDVHYLNREDKEAHEALLCIATGTNIHNPNRLRFDTDQLYFKSAEEMQLLFPGEYLATSIEIADKCNVEIELNRTMHIYEPKSAFNSLKEICDEKIVGQPTRYMERYRKELEAIEKTGYAEYLMVVADFIRFAKDHNIPVGAGRGSSAGSLVCYLLGITEIDPLEHDLLFERFININRVEPPDIDVDICQSRRKEVIDYLKQKYGEDRVAQIVTFGSLKTKAAIRDSCRVLQLPFGIGDAICKQIPDVWEESVTEALNLEPVTFILQENVDSFNIELLKYTASRLEGRLRHSSTHAAGIVISDKPLIEVTPLFKRTGSNDILTQYDMNAIGKLGLLKFDILGLRTLTVIADTCRSLNMNPQDIPLDDSIVYMGLGQGDTVGIFQYEGYGYTKFIKRMQPQKFEDLVALGALYRPGPLNSGMADDYIARKNGTPYKNEFPGITDNTYGILLYQEQIMRMVVAYAGFTMDDADTLRKAIGKKDQDLMMDMIKYLPNYLVDRIVTFGRYGWNRAHAVSYALLSYQTAYLKYNHPVHYFCALLNSEITDNKRLPTLQREAHRCGIMIEPPHINLSDKYYTAHGNRLYAGLLSIKGIGARSCDAILQEREKGKYESKDDFRSRIAPRMVNSLAFKALEGAETFR